MPSPVGHALAAVAVGATVRGLRGLGAWRETAVLAAIGMAPDLDLLIGRHSRETHSIGAAVLAATAAVVITRIRPVPGASAARIWWTVALAWLSHPILDMLSFDTSPPIGVMFFWPFSHAHVQTGLSVFGPISRSFRTRAFWVNNLASVVREVLILGPIACAVLWWQHLRPGALAHDPRGHAGRDGPGGHR